MLLSFDNCEQERRLESDFKVKGSTIICFQDGVRAYTIYVESRILRITIECGQLNVWSEDAKLTSYDTTDGHVLYVQHHNGSKLSKEEKKKRKLRYLSAQEAS